MRAVVLCASVIGVVVAGVEPASAICREVVKRGSPPPLIEPQQPVLLLLRHDVVVGQICEPPADGADAGAAGDAGTDAGPPSDAAVPDAGIADGGAPDAGPGTECQPRYGDAVTMVVQPRFTLQEGGSRFALLMVTPRPPVVEAAAPDLFLRLAEATYPEVVTNTVYVEDEALGYQCQDPKWNQSSQGCAGGYGGGGGSGWDDDWSDPSTASDASPPGDGAVIQTVGSYEVAVLAVTDVSGFTAWLDANDYAWDAADLDALAPYLAMGWTVIAIKISGDQAVQHGGLEPLAFTWEGSELRVPVGVSRYPEGGQTLLSIFVAADGRYDVPGATVGFAQPTSSGGGSFLTRNEYFADLSAPAAADPVATRVAGDPQHRDSVTVTEEVHIPSSKCPGGVDRESLCGCRTGGRQLGNWLLAVVAAIILAGGTRRKLLARISGGRGG